MVALDQVQELNGLTAAIKSANDPPRTLEELQDRVNLPDRSGYHRHHIVEESAGRRAGFSEELIQGRDNLVLVPVTKHIEISSYYTRKVLQADGTRLSLRQQMESLDFESRRQFGLKVLQDKGVLK